MCTIILNASNRLRKESVIRNMLGIYLFIFKLDLLGQPVFYHTLQLSYFEIQKCNILTLLHIR